MTKKKNIPDIRFKGFSEEWEEKRLGNESEIIAGGTPSTAIIKYWKPKEISWMSSGEINKKRLFDTDNMISKNGYNNSSARWIKKNSVLIALAGQGKTRGTVAINKIPLTTNQSIAAIIPNSNIYYEFLFQNLENRYEELRTKSSGDGSRGGLNKQIISEIDIICPSITEQTKIGNYFKNLDQLITQHQQKYDKLLTIKKAMLKKMFPQNGANVPEIRFKGFSGEWEEKSLGEIGDTYTGLSGKTKEDFGHGNGKFITYMNVFSNPIAKPDLTEPIEVDNKQNEIKKGDVFFTTSSETPEEVGMSSVWLGDSENMYLNSFCFGYRPDEQINSFYLAYMFRSSYFRKKITFLAQGISRYNISKNKVMEIVVSIPDIKEQEAIGNFFKNLDKIISLNNQKLQKLKNIKKAFLDKMFV